MWLEEKFHLKVSQGSISNTLKRSSFDQPRKRRFIKWHELSKFSDMEKVVYEWFFWYQHVNMTGELIFEKARDAMILGCPQQDFEYKFSQGWLKNSSYDTVSSHFVASESGLVDIQDMEKQLESMRETIDKFLMKDAFNMDETGFFTSYKLFMLLLQSNLKEENKTKKGLQ